MANTTFGNLKKKALQKAGNNYNQNDSTKLEMAGGIINDIMGIIQSLIKGHPFTLDIGNTVSTVANQPYVALTETDIIEVYNVYQRVTDVALSQLTYNQYIALAPDPTRFAGVSDIAWAPTQTIDGSGNPTWSLYLLPTPSSIMTLYYDYVKNLRFSSDSSSADAEYSKLPSTYDGWIYAEFKPLFYEIIDPKNSTLIARAKQDALEARSFNLTAINSQGSRIPQVSSRRGDFDIVNNWVKPTPVP